MFKVFSNHSVAAQLNNLRSLLKTGMLSLAISVGLLCHLPNAKCWQFAVGGS